MGTMCVTCSCTCTDLELSGMLPHGTRGILSHDSQKSKPYTPLGIQASPDLGKGLDRQEAVVLMVEEMKDEN